MTRRATLIIIWFNKFKTAGEGPAVLKMFATILLLDLQHIVQIFITGFNTCRCIVGHIMLYKKVLHT